MSGARRTMPAVADLVRKPPAAGTEALDPELWSRMDGDQRAEALRMLALDLHTRLRRLENDARTEF